MIIDEKNIIKMSILHRAIYIIPTKILMAFSTNRTKSSKICMEPQTIPGNQSILRKKNNLEASHIQISSYITKLQ